MSEFAVCVAGMFGRFRMSEFAVCVAGFGRFR